jgi:magnesium and cobalt transporter
MPEAPLIPFEVYGWACGLLLPTAVLTAVMSALLERTGPIRLRHWAEEAGGRLRQLYDSPVRFGVFRYILSLTARLAPIGVYAALAGLLGHWGVSHASLWALAVVLVLTAGTEAANRALVGHDPERALRAMTRVYRVLLRLLSPLVSLIEWLLPTLPMERERRQEEESEASDEEIEAFIDVGTREGILEPEQGEWLWSIVGFRDSLARSIMTPRIDMICAPVDAALDVLADRFVESGHSRIPLYQDSIDNIVGVLHIRDVLRALRQPEPPTGRELMKPPLFVPETKPLPELLKELQARFQQVAIVVDEYGGTAGLVTVEDLIEEIVGEIMDEHEALVAELEPLENGYRLDGRAHIELLDELFGVEVEDPEYETVAGLIFSALGHVPEVGEAVEELGLRFTVEAVADRRIQTVRIERLPVAGESKGEAEEEAG